MFALSRRDWLLLSSAALGLAGNRATTRADSNSNCERSFHFDHLLGTSLDVWLTCCTQTELELAETVSLNEIERLRKIFSTYDPDSELSRWNQSSGPVSVSAELSQVLQEYQQWMKVTSGACNPQLGNIIQRWQQAEIDDTLPEPVELLALANAIQHPTWQLDPEKQVATRRSDIRLNLNAVVKGYAVQRLAEVIREAVPSCESGLVNLGGDLLSWGSRTWAVAVQNPAESAENAKPLQGLSLSNAALATSGGYQRYYTIQGQPYSHLIDPRTGQPADAIASATVLAPTSTMANALATTLGVLSISEALRLIQSFPNTEALLIGRDGQVTRTVGFPNDTVVANVEKPVFISTLANPWPEGHEVAVKLELPVIENVKKYRRPYVAVWIENASGKSIRTLTVWGNAPKYLKDLTDWWKFAREDQPLVKAVARATRGPGKYELVWDGKDDKGKLVEQGTFTIRVEVHREHGKHLRQTGKIEILDKATSIKLDKNDETGETTVEFRKKKPS